MHEELTALLKWHPSSYSNEVFRLFLGKIKVGEAYRYRPFEWKMDNPSVTRPSGEEPVEWVYMLNDERGVSPDAPRFSNSYDAKVACMRAALKSITEG